MVQVIGEAANHIPKHFLDPKLHQTLHELNKNRNTLVHEYFVIDFEELWHNATVVLPLIQFPLQQVYEQNEDKYQSQLQLNYIARATTTLPDGHLTTTDYPLMPLSENTVKATQKEREIPYFLRGRADEFNFLARRLHGGPKPISLVTGPPESGKTARLRAVQEYARRLGHVVVQPKPEELLDGITIVEKCRAAVMSTADAPDTSTIDNAANLHIELAAHAQDIFTTLGAEIDTTKQHNEADDDEHNYIDLLQHLRAVCHYQARHHRVLITCDDIDELPDILGQHSKARCYLRTNLSILNKAIRHETMHLPITTILTDQDPAGDFLQNIVTRTADKDDLHLTPIPPEYGCLILWDHLNVDGLPELRTFFDPALIDRWGNQCHGYVEFASRLGQLLQTYARYSIAKGVTRAASKDRQNIEDAFHTQRTEYYTQRLPTVTNQDDEEPLHLLVHHLAAACSPEHPCHEPQSGMPPLPLTWHALDVLTNIVLQPQFPHASNEDPAFVRTREDILTELHQRNIVRSMQATSELILLDRTNNPRSRVIFPIPGILHHIGIKAMQLSNETCTLIKNNVRTMYQEIATVRHQPNTRWQWKNVTRRAPIPWPPNDPQSATVLYEHTPQPQPPRQEDDNSQPIPDPIPRGRLPQNYQPRNSEPARNIADS